MKKHNTNVKFHLMKTSLILLFCLCAPTIKAQISCAPFYVIGETNENKIWKAVFQDCLDFQFPVIKYDDNPSTRAAIIAKFKIKKIISKRSEEEVPHVEYLDQEGYTIFNGSGSDTSSGSYYLNDFNEQHLLSGVTYKSGYSFSGIKGPDVEDIDTLPWTTKFIYDNRKRLIRKKETQFYLLNHVPCIFHPLQKPYKRPHRSTFAQSWQYNSSGNIIKNKTSQGSCDIFEYDSTQKLILAKDMTRHLANAEAWHFFYNSDQLIDSIQVTYDNKSFKGYNIDFVYDNNHQLINIVKYYADGKIWNDTKFVYDNGQLAEIIESVPLHSMCSERKFYYNKEGLIQKMEYWNNYKMEHWTEYNYALF